MPVSGPHHPIFVVGYLHSGTTLMQQIIGKSEAVYPNFGETRFFDSLPFVLDKFPNLENNADLHAYVDYLIEVIQVGFTPVNLGIPPKVEPPWLDISEASRAAIYADARAAGTHEAIYRVVFDHLATLADKERWLEKTPTHLFHVPAILSVLPDALFLAMVRDGRDILASKKSRRDRGSSFDPLWDMLAWRAAVNVIHAAQRQHPESVIVVHYEDFVSDPAGELKRICAGLDLPYDPAMLEVGWINTTTIARDKPRTGIGTAAIGKWKTVLTPQEAALAQLVGRSELESLGYSVEKTPISAYVGLPLVLARSSVEFFTRLHARWRMGGTAYLRNVLHNYRLRLLGLSDR